MPPEPDLVTLPDVQAAARLLAGQVVRTPLLPVPAVDGDDRGGLWLKPENLQPTGAFKVRGACHAVARLPAGTTAVVTHSSGNHGQALAYAAHTAGLSCTVVMPEQAAPHKIAAVRRWGARVALVPPDDRLPRALAIAAQPGTVLVDPHDDRHVIAGHGTVGLEIVEDRPDVEVVLVPVGGGALASGVAAAVTGARPGVRVVGVEPELAADAKESLAAGRLCRWPAERTYRTVADGLRTPLSEVTLAHLSRSLAGIVTVTEEEILAATAALPGLARLVAEPSGAVALAAWLYRRDELPPGRTVAVVSGGNVDPGLLSRLLADPPRPPG